MLQEVDELLRIDGPLSERVQGMEGVHLWPHDFPENTKATTTATPLATLWRPGFSGVLATAFAINGLERARSGDGWRWYAQRWLCEPITREQLASDLEWDAKSRPPWLRLGQVG